MSVKTSFHIMDVAFALGEVGVLDGNPCFSVGDVVKYDLDLYVVDHIERDIGKYTHGTAWCHFHIYLKEV